MEGIYPMPMFLSLEVADVQASTRWYREALGFRSIFEAPASQEPKPSMVHLRRLRYQDILLFAASEPSDASLGRGAVLNLLPGEPLDRIAARVRAVRPSAVEGPLERPWNVRELTVQDPDGYLIRLSEPLDTGKPLDEVLKNMRDD